MNIVIFIFKISSNYYLCELVDQDQLLKKYTTLIFSDEFEGNELDQSKWLNKAYSYNCESKVKIFQK